VNEVSSRSRAGLRFAHQYRAVQLKNGRKARRAGAGKDSAFSPRASAIGWDGQRSSPTRYEVTVRV
jgi:hypothetical protein